jgi:hypothetical protein
LSGFYGLGKHSDIRAVQVGIRSFNRHLAAVWHSVARVQRKIEKGVFKLIDIRLCYPKSGS